jgi:hypothetical protein
MPRATHIARFSQRARMRLLAGGLLMLAAAQLVRIPRTNPAIGNALAPPVAVKTVLRRACYDCHSSETAWPWYTGVAPISWLAYRDVAQGRMRLDFSNWGAYVEDPETAINKLEKIRRQAADAEMPPWYYRLLHPEAHLSAADRQILASWANEEISRLRRAEAREQRE